MTRPSLERWRNRRAWERKWKRSDRDPPWLEHGPRRHVRAAVETGWLPPSASVVDVGCGIGNTAGWLASLGHEVLGLDVSAAAIARAQDAHGGVLGLSFQRADITKPLRRADTFDVLLDLGCLHQLSRPVPAAYGDNVRRLIGPGARCLFLLRTDFPDRTAAFVQQVLGVDFELELAEVTEMQAARVESPRLGVELRFVRRPLP